MPDNSRHICTEVNLTADYDGSEFRARLFMKELPHMVNNALNYVSDELDGLSELKNQSIRFRELSIDIGSIDERYFKDEFKNRLKKALFDKIDQVDVDSAISDANVESIDIGTESGHLIRHLLCYGTAPWWADEKRNLQLQHLFREFIKERPQQAIILLRETGHLPPVRRRLIQRLDKRTLFSIVHLIEPVEAVFIRAFLESIAGFLAERRSAGAKRMWIVWDAVLDYLFTNNSRQFNREEFIGYAVERMTSEGGSDKQSLLQYLISNNERGSDNSLIRILKSDKSSAFKSDEKGSLKLSDEWTDLTNLLLQDDVERSSADKQAVRDRWRNLFKQSRESTFKKFKVLARERVVRRNISIFLPDKDLQILVSLAEPANASFIIDHSKRSAKVRELIPDLQIPKAELKAKSWEFILTYLFEDKGSQFNRKQFLKSTLEQFSAHYNLRYSKLLRYFIVLTSDGQPGQASSVHSILTELEMDEQKSDHQEKGHGSWTVQGDMKIATEKAKLLTFSSVAKFAEEFYQLARHDPARLRHLLKTDEYNEEGISYIWSFLSRSQKGIVLLAVSPSKIRGWEQLISQIETIASASKGINHTVELDKVFNLVFSHGVLKDGDMDSLLSLYLSELAATNQSTKEIILSNLVQGLQNADDQYLLKYLKLHSDAVSKHENGRSLKTGHRHESLSDSMFSRIDELFKQSESESSTLAAGLFRSMNESDLQRASIYISSKRGWKILAGKLSADDWRDLAGNILKGELRDQALAIFDLFRQIYQTQFTGNPLLAKLQKLQGSMMHIIMSHAPDMNGGQLLQHLLRMDGNQYKIHLEPESVMDIQKTVSSTQTLFFNQWMQWQAKQKDNSVPYKKEPEDKSSEDAARILTLLEKLKSSEPDSNDVLLFPLLMHLLEKREKSVEHAIREFVRDPAFLNMWANSLPPSILNEISARLMPEKHLYKAKKMLLVMKPVFGDMLRKSSQDRFQAEILLKYSAGNRYKDYSPSALINVMLNVLGEKMAPSMTEKKWKEISARIKEQIKKNNIRTVSSIERVLTSFPKKSVEPRAGPADTTVEKSEEVKSLKKAFSLDEKIFDGESLYTGTAGLVIAAPFFPSLFKKLGYLHEQKFINEELRSRAVHVIEFIATGRQDAEEHKLVLQKLLAGLPVPAPVDTLDLLTEEEVSISESMLSGLMGNWPGLENTSIAGLRETFLRREGRLRKDDDQWELTVQAKGFDMLLDRIPWSISMIKLPWMKHVLRVEWR